MSYPHHYLEKNSVLAPRFRNRERIYEHKVAVWNTLVDSGLSDITEDDCAIFPRILPASYLPEIEKTVHDICSFAFRLLSLPAAEIKSIIPSGPVRDFLIEELEVLRYRTPRWLGSMRLDLALVGAPEKGNPPQFLEINEIGFDGLARSSMIQQTLLDLLPEVKKKLIWLDTLEHEFQNMKINGSSVLRLQEDSYNWDEEHLVRSAARQDLWIQLMCPRQFGLKPDAEDFPMMKWENLLFPQGRLVTSSGLRPSSYQMSFALNLADYQKYAPLFRQLVKSKTPAYGSFLMGLVASKIILVLLDDSVLRRRLLGSSKKLQSSLLHSWRLGEQIQDVQRHPSKYVLKHIDGYGGEQVYLGSDLKKQLRKISPQELDEWIVQIRTRLNLFAVEGILSRPKHVISDLGVFVHYDYAHGKIEKFKVGGFITRATNRGYKVNVSSGGIQIPIVFQRGR